MTVRRLRQLAVLNSRSWEIQAKAVVTAPAQDTCTFDNPS